MELVIEVEEVMESVVEGREEFVVVSVDVLAGVVVAVVVDVDAGEVV